MVGGTHDILWRSFLCCGFLKLQGLRLDSLNFPSICPSVCLPVFCPPTRVGPSIALAASSVPSICLSFHPFAGPSVVHPSVGVSVHSPSVHAAAASPAASAVAPAASPLASLAAAVASPVRRSICCSVSRSISPCSPCSPYLP